jgi:hypothetical protein
MHNRLVWAEQIYTRDNIRLTPFPDWSIESASINPGHDTRFPNQNSNHRSSRETVISLLLGNEIRAKPLMGKKTVTTGAQVQPPPILKAGGQHAKSNDYHQLTNTST